MIFPLNLRWSLAGSQWTDPLDLRWSLCKPEGICFQDVWWSGLTRPEVFCPINLRGSVRSTWDDLYIRPEVIILLNLRWYFTWTEWTNLPTNMRGSIVSISTYQLGSTLFKKSVHVFLKSLVCSIFLSYSWCFYSPNFYSTPPDLIDVQEDSGLTPLSIQLPSHSGPFYLDQAPARGPSSLPYTSYFYYIMYTVR